MGKLSSKNKIYIGAALWLVLCGSMFGYFFHIFEGSTQTIMASVTVKQRELRQVKLEENSFKQAKADLDKMKSQNVQVKDIFSKDITLVNEIKVLEDLSEKLDVVVNIAGVAGTVNSVPKKKIQSVILYVPYSMNISGKFSNVMGFIEALENLGFITNITRLSFGAGDGDNINASFSTSFYLKQ